MIPSQQEYEQFRSPPELLLFWKQCCESLTYEEWRLRNGTIAKRILEELGPIAYFSMKYFKPGLEVQARGLIGNQPYDGEIQVSGWLERSFKVEVANAIEYEDALRRELLHCEGCSPGWGTIKRENGKITAEGGAHSYGEDMARLGKISAERFSAKQSEHTYENGTVLIIQFDFHRGISHDEYNLIYAPLREAISLHGCQFAELHVFNSCNNELRKVSP